MHDALHAGNRVLDLRHAGKVGFDESLVGRKIGRAPKVA